MYISTYSYNFFTKYKAIQNHLSDSCNHSYNSNWDNRIMLCYKVGGGLL